jgi:5-methylcytosine-specific restriction endonuclease McrA
MHEKKNEICKKHGLTPYSQTRRSDNGHIRWKCDKCNYEKVVEYRRKKKLWALNYLGNKCSVCGYDKCLQALEFHHKMAKDKEFQLSKYTHCSYKVLKDELDKCTLVCSNCHREIHYL